MSTPRSVCHRCRTKWKVKRKEVSRECPKCGCTNVGPTDPAGGSAGLVVVVLLVALGGAWYFDLLPSEAKEALDDARNAVESNLEDARREVEGEDEDERPRRTQKTKKPKRKTTKAPRPKAKPATPRAAEPKRPEPDAQPLPVAQVVVSSKSGALIGSAYLVKGKIKNTGGVEATRVSVVVTFERAGGATTKVLASCATSVAAGKTARYEAAVAGDEAHEVESFSVKATFD